MALNFKKTSLLIVICGITISAAGCIHQSAPPPVVKTINQLESAPSAASLSNDEIMKKYVAEFLTKGYSKHYIINDIESTRVIGKQTDTTIDVDIFTKMTTSNFSKNPDAVPYIKTAKEKAFNETNPDKKQLLQQEYWNLYNDYMKPSEANFHFLLTAQLKDGKIDEASIELYTAIDIDQGVRYEPAENILPKK